MRAMVVCLLGGSESPMLSGLYGHLRPGVCVRMLWAPGSKSESPIRMGGLAGRRACVARANASVFFKLVSVLVVGLCVLRNRIHIHACDTNSEVAPRSSFFLFSS